MSQEFIKPTKVWAYMKEKEMRVSGDAKPKIIELLNDFVASELESIIDKLPKFTKGENKGTPKRKTIKLEDL